MTETDVVTVTTAASQAVRHYPRFQMPSGNIGCIYESRVLRCDILSGLKPEPGASCELDWTGVVLEADGAAQPECAGDTVYDENAPVLRYGEQWSGEGIICSSTRDGLRCAGAAGHGFSLTRSAWVAS